MISQEKIKEYCDLTFINVCDETEDMFTALKRHQFELGVQWAISEIKKLTYEKHISADKEIEVDE